MVPRCGWCETVTGQLVEVGFIEANSGPGWWLYACPGCAETYRIVPLDEHPPDSRGGVRYRPREAARRVLGNHCEAAARDPKIAPLAHRYCHGNGEVRLPNDPPTARPVYEYRCDCACHQPQETTR
jgi:hypothetical protein